MRRFFLGLWLVTAACHLVFFAAAREGLVRVGAPYATWIALAASVVPVALFRARLSLITNDRPISAIRRAFELAYYTHWCGTLGALLLFVPAAVVLLLAAAIARMASARLPLNHGDLALVSYAIGSACATWGVWVRGRRARVRHIEIPVLGLAAALDGYRIAQLSDLHVGALLGPRVAARWIALANAEAPDLIALTGDYVTNGVRFHHQIAELLGELRARDGVVATLGNHDYFGAGEPLVSLLRAKGIALLRNERIAIERDGASLEVAGVDDTWTRKADVEGAMRGFRGGRPLVALTHDPSLFPDFVRHGAALVLAGHTHWGQVGVPFLADRYNLAHRVYRFSAGLYREGNSRLYVSPGLGTTGPPIRFGIPAEITVLVLRCA